MNTRKRIREAFLACSRLCEGSADADRWFQRAYEAALAGEKQHRKIPGRYRLPLAAAAEWFAVKWFLELDSLMPQTWADACAIRDDYRYAKGARDACFREKGKSLEWANLTNKFSDVVEIDYLKEFTHD